MAVCYPQCQIGVRIETLCLPLCACIDHLPAHIVAVCQLKFRVKFLDFSLVWQHPVLHFAMQSDRRVVADKILQAAYAFKTCELALCKERVGPNLCIAIFCHLQFEIFRLNVLRYISVKFCHHRGKDFLVDRHVVVLEEPLCLPSSSFKINE